MKAVVGSVVFVRGSHIQCDLITVTHACPLVVTDIQPTLGRNSQAVGIREE
jgi:hypothetical protein